MLHHVGQTDDVKDIANGWKWLSSNFVELRRLATSIRLPGQQAIFTEHRAAMISAAHPGAGLCGRLDACLVMARALAKECPEYGPPDDIWISELDEMFQGLADESEAAQDKADERHRTGWAEWLDRSFKGGARAMHRYTRIQEAWAPAVTTRRGTVTAAPHDIVESELDALVEHWKAETFAERVEVPDRQAFPRASPDAIRAASLSFSALTSQSLDGIHPRQLSLLSDSALGCLAARSALPKGRCDAGCSGGPRLCACSLRCRGWLRDGCMHVRIGRQASAAYCSRVAL